MSVKTIQPRLNNSGAVTGAATGADTVDRYSPGIWDDCMVVGIGDGELAGEVFEFDFDTLPTTPPTTEGAFGLFSVFTSTGGTIANPATGFRGWDIGSDGDNEGVVVRAKATSFRIDRSMGKLWFEAMIKSSTIADTKHNFLVGLCEDVAGDATHPLTATGTLSDNNMVVFHRPETAKAGAGTGGATVNVEYKAAGVTAVTVAQDITTLVADTYVKLGMKFVPSVDEMVQDPNFSSLGKYNLFFYVNGVRISTSKIIPTAQGTDFPNSVRLAPFFSVMNATASTPGTTCCRRMRVAQMY